MDLKKTQREAGDYARLVCTYMWYICHCYCIAGHLLKSSGALMYLKLSLTFISAVGCQNSCVWVMFWILYPCRNLQHWGHSTAFFLLNENCGIIQLFLFIACRQLRKTSSAMGDKLNQTNNSGDNNLGHFFKATDFDDIAMKVKIMKIILNNLPCFVLAFSHVRSS